MSYPSNRWEPFDLSAAEISTVEGKPDIMGVQIGDGISSAKATSSQMGAPATSLCQRSRLRGLHRPPSSNPTTGCSGQDRLAQHLGRLRERRGAL
jgi:hypothetical protein